MILDIPTRKDFEDTGLSLLNYSWDTVISLIAQIYEASEWGIDTEEVNDAYWDSAKQHLTTSLSVAQQGVEFILKGRIAEVSPFLLISGVPKEWPKNCQNENISFSKFRTIDAQDLIKVHNTCSSNKLCDDFIEKFEELRVKRNSIIHSIDKKVKVHALDVIVEILTVHKHLFPEENWLSVRKEFILRSPITELVGDDMSSYEISKEFTMIVDILKPSQTKKFLGIDKNQRLYICPACTNELADYEMYPESAQLKPNEPNSENVHCFVCENNMKVSRNDCDESECKGNVIYDAENLCLTCGVEQG